MSKVLVVMAAGALLVASSILGMAQTNDADKPGGKSLGGGGESSSGGSGPGPVESAGRPAGSSDSGSGTPTSILPAGGTGTGGAATPEGQPSANASPAKPVPPKAAATSNQAEQTAPSGGFTGQ